MTTNPLGLVQPISPADVAKQKKADFPPLVIQAFNEMIAKKFSGVAATVFQDEVTKLIAEKLGCSEKLVYERGWLNVEEIYKEAGWKVMYEKPAYNETGRSFYTFRV